LAGVDSDIANNIASDIHVKSGQVALKVSRRLQEVKNIGYIRGVAAGGVAAGGIDADIGVTANGLGDDTVTDRGVVEVIKQSASCAVIIDG
jgi:hypothetical protein